MIKQNTFLATGYLLIFLLFTAILPNTAFAFDMATGYTLPYPPQMPGNFLYKIRVIEEKIQAFWNFGSFATF